MSDVNAVLRDRDETRRRRRRLMHGILGCLVAFGIVLGAAWVGIRSPMFNIKNITVIGNHAADPDDIIRVMKVLATSGSRIRHYIGSENMLLWPDSARAEALRLLPQVKRVVVEKNYNDRTILLRVEERQAYGIWCLVRAQTNADQHEGEVAGDARDDLRDESENPRCFWFDQEGIIFRPAPFSEGSIIPVISDASQDELRIPSAVLPNAFLENLFSIFRVLRSSGVRAREIRLDDLNLRELTVKTFDGPELYFSLRFPADAALVEMKSLFGSDATSSFANLLYIDFRVENRVYYK